MSDDTLWTFDDDDFYECDSWREQIEFLLRYAVLAPSGHNTQPWRFEITPLGVHIFPDYSRRLRYADPENRELLMSLGAAIANLRVAAAHFGFESVLSFPADYDRRHPVAFIPIRETGERDPKLAPLFPFIKVRRTNRHPFDHEAIEPRALSPILDFIDEHPDTFRVVFPHDAQRAADLVALAGKLQMDDEQCRAELASLPTGAVGFPAEWAPMLVVVASNDETVALIETGEALELFLLTVTRERLQYSFLNAPVQLSGLRDQVAMLARSHRPPQLIIRIGSGQRLTVPTPRRPVREVLS